MLGGDKYEQPFGGDWLTVNPETVDEMVSFFLGSFGRQVYSGFGNVVTGKGWEVRNVPVIQAFYKGRTADFNMDRKYFNLIEMVDRIESQLKEYKDRGDLSSLKEYRIANKEVAKISKMIENVAKRKGYWARQKEKAGGKPSQQVEKSAESDLRKGKAAVLREARKIGLRI